MILCAKGMVVPVSSSGQRCSRCKSVSYCGRECQVTHWKAHKAQCHNHEWKSIVESERARFRKHEAAMQYKEDANAPQFVNVLQGRAAYIESASTPNHIAGLYTDGFNTCNIVILTATVMSSVRVELLHVDEQFSMDQMAKEIKEFRFFGGELLVQVVYKAGKGQGVLDRLHSVFAEQNVSSKDRAVTDTVDAVSIRRDGTHLCLSQSRLDHANIRLLRHPNERDIKLVSKVREVVGFDSAKWSLYLFYETDWSTYADDTRLNEYTEKLLQSNKLKGETSLLDVECILRRMHKEGQLSHLQQCRQDLENIMRIGAMYVAEFLRRRDRIDFATALHRDVRTLMQAAQASPKIKLSHEAECFFAECLALPKEEVRTQLAAKLLTDTDLRILSEIYDVVLHLFRILRLYDYCTLYK